MTQYLKIFIDSSISYRNISSLIRSIIHSFISIISSIHCVSSNSMFHLCRQSSFCVSLLICIFFLSAQIFTPYSINLFSDSIFSANSMKAASAFSLPYFPIKILPAELAKVTLHMLAITYVECAVLFVILKILLVMQVVALLSPT